jgi:hypothetical protein
MARLSSQVMDAVKHPVPPMGGDFIVVELKKDEVVPVYGSDGQLLKFTTGKEAQSYAATLITGGRKFQPRRVKDDGWQDREAKRFTSKEYQELPWSTHRWWREHQKIHGLHFPHVSTKNSVGLMAFTETEEKGSADIQTAIKPGKYLERYFGSILDLHIIRDLCTIFSNKFEDNVLIYAEDEDEFEQIYTSGPSSCMSHELSKYTSHIHPVRVYAAGDLKLVYMKRDGRIVARTLVWPEKKMYTRIYGDSGRIEPLLRKEGFHKGTPFGAKLQRVICFENKARKSGQRAFVLPHIDDANHVVDKGDHLLIGGEGISQKGDTVVKCVGANGVSEWLSTQCFCCQREFPTSQTLAMLDGDGERSGFVCFSCLETAKDKVFKCPVSGYAFRIEHGVRMFDGTYMWLRSFREHGFTCQLSNERYPRGEAITLQDGRRVARAVFRQRGGKACGTCGKQVLEGCNESCKTAHVAKQAERRKATLLDTAGQWQTVSMTTNDVMWLGDAPPRRR